MKLALAVLSLALAACTSTTDHVAPDPASGGPPAPSMDEIMARMAELGTPGPEHAFLNDMVGTFDATMTMWLEPGAEPTVTNGRLINHWILDGRFVQGDYTSEFMGQPFQGMSLTGYDKSKGAYVSTWLDNSSTWILPVSVGAKEGSTITFTREMLDPITEMAGKSREVLTIDDATTHHYTMYNEAPDGSETKSMEIVYHRVP